MRTHLLAVNRLQMETVTSLAFFSTGLDSLLIVAFTVQCSIAIVASNMQAEQHRKETMVQDAQKGQPFIEQQHSAALTLATERSFVCGLG